MRARVCAHLPFYLPWTPHKRPLPRAAATVGLKPRGGGSGAVGACRAGGGGDRGETLPLPCVSTAFVASKTVPFLAATRRPGETPRWSGLGRRMGSGTCCTGRTLPVRAALSHPPSISPCWVAVCGWLSVCFRLHPSLSHCFACRASRTRRAVPPRWCRARVLRLTPSRLWGAPGMYDSSDVRDGEGGGLWRRAVAGVFAAGQSSGCERVEACCVAAGWKRHGRDFPQLSAACWSHPRTRVHSGREEREERGDEVW